MSKDIPTDHDEDFLDEEGGCDSQRAIIIYYERGPLQNQILLHSHVGSRSFPSTVQNANPSKRENGN